MALKTSTHRDVDAILDRCIHCGLCLPVCPTYALTQREESSPRGRIRLVHALSDGSLRPGRQFADEMTFCLDCQACETACPAGVRYGAIVEDARRMIVEERLDRRGERLVRKIMLDGILASPVRTKMFARILRWYEAFGLRDAVEQSGILALFSDALHEKHALLPHVAGAPFDDVVPDRIPGEPPVRGRVALLTGCIMNVAMQQIHQDTLTVLVRNGFDVLVPKGQVCCGSLHAHNGSPAGALELARKNLDLFRGLSVDALIVDSAGCGAFLKEYGTLFEGDDERREDARRLSEITRDVTEFLAEVGIVPPEVSLDCDVTYHEACHLVHTQKISAAPREVIRSIPGVRFVELPESTWCCGSAGIYNIVRFHDSMQMLDRKMSHVVSTRAQIILTGNPGCHLQIEHGVRRAGIRAEVLHPVSLLARAYRNSA